VRITVADALPPSCMVPLSRLRGPTCCICIPHRHALCHSGCRALRCVGHGPLSRSVAAAVVPDANNDITISELDLGPPVRFIAHSSGWEIHDTRFAYDNLTDTLYIGALGGPLSGAGAGGRREWLHYRACGLHSTWPCPR
jgi:hypothetical protein